MGKNYSLKASLVITLLTFEILISDYVFSERYVKVAAIGNIPPKVESGNQQVIVDHVIKFWDVELKKVLRKNPDLIVLPEFCDLSTLGIEYLNVRKDQVLDFFISVAKRNNCYIAFGMCRLDSAGIWRNSCMLIGRKGEIAGIYDKNYLTLGEMQIGIKACDKAIVIETDFGRIAVAICLDLNFNELMLKYASQKPDLIIFSSTYHGGVAQSLWAYTCQSYFVGAVYRGHPSQIRNPLGEVIASSTMNNDYAVADINLDFKRVHLAYNIVNLAALKNKYGSTVKITDPGEYASVIVSSENENVTVEQMIKEFEIIEFNEYLDQLREIRHEGGNIK